LPGLTLSHLYQVRGSNPGNPSAPPIRNGGHCLQPAAGKGRSKSGK
jgi:hypothetical protein